MLQLNKSKATTHCDNDINCSSIYTKSYVIRFCRIYPVFIDKTLLYCHVFLSGLMVGAISEKRVCALAFSQCCETHTRAGVCLLVCDAQPCMHAHLHATYTHAPDLTHTPDAHATF